MQNSYFLLLTRIEDLIVRIYRSQTYYNLTGYGDELLWAASWLYHVTGDDSYLEFVTGQDGEDYAQWEAQPGSVLLARLSFFKAKDISNSYGSRLSSYRKTAQAVMCGLLPDSPTATKSRTDTDKLQTNKESYRRRDIPMAEINKLRDKIRVPKANYCS
ncbi:hypothetical protein Fmac_015197 [Flemingia macrophylla]|uniref:cellulase n=1 Tax=Flemingia macrophylla TaxID=520843 RepID=A0ABD1MDX3_9FABA